MKKRADHEPGYVLHTYPYKETSLIVEAFTRRHGRVALLARGARRPRSAMRGVLLAFHPLRLGWSGYAPVFDRDASTGAPIEPAGSYVYEPDRGPVRASHGDLVISGRTLLDLAADDYSRSETRDEARYLMRALIGQRLHGQVLHTRSVLMELNEL